MTFNFQSFNASSHESMLWLCMLEAYADASWNYLIARCLYGIKTISCLMYSKSPWGITCEIVLVVKVIKSSIQCFMFVIRGLNS
ncbi:CLUMA_CG014764, isoform A [Clunio marinus]|uniref:CLUMA_CG014764, isoform A n=1 Tax=Clunio marinus TaxID=568069 RepID=A0A1J1IMH3_9DIPT|nr:CLUMA_CG014764, isoform A [Clunio marinus]